jgi:predicted Rossmann-fold nucleotide-binding protein
MGSHKVIDAAQERLAIQLGPMIATNGWHLLSGGGEGVMEATCEAFTEGGIPSMLRIKLVFLPRRGPYARELAQ